MRFIPLFSMFILLFCSCGDTIVENNSGTNVSSDGSVSVIASDAATGLPVKDASVMLLGRDGKVRKADSKGGVFYEKLPIGKGYTFHIEAAGYASIKCKSDVSLDSMASGKDAIITNDIVLEAKLPKLGAKLHGSIAYMDLSTNAVNTQAAGNDEAKVRLKLGMQGECELLDPYREAATGLNGTYFFDSLPELANYDLTAMEAEISGTVYESFLIQNGGALGLSGDIAKAPLGIYKNAFSQEEFLLLSAPDTVGTNGKISLIFSKNVNKSRISSATFSITGVNYAVEVKWNDERTLEISPVNGLWKLDDLVSISNEEELYATDGTLMLSGNLANVTVTGGVLGTVSRLWLENAGTGTALDLSSDYLDLDALLSQQKGLVFRWNKARNATGYTLYAKCANDINYTRIENLSFASDTSAVWGYSQIYNCMEQDKTAGFFVQAKNAREHTNSKVIYIMGYVNP